MYSLNKYLPVTNYRQHNIKYEGKKDTVHLQGASNQENRQKTYSLSAVELKNLFSGAKLLVFNSWFCYLSVL